MSLDEAISSLRKGEFILVHDANKRENEVDMVVAAEFVTPAHIARMRQDAGGLICLSINHSFAKSLGLNSIGPNRGYWAATACKTPSTMGNSFGPGAIPPSPIIHSAFST